jgi:polysaccharide biosynthesis/export protein
MRKRLQWVLISWMACAAGTVWGQAPRVGKEPAPSTTDTKGGKGIQEPAKPVDPTLGVPGVNPNSYEIGGEDVLYIKTWRQPDFTFNTVVRPDGKISIPLVGEVQASGKTPATLEKEIAKALGVYIQNPDVTITVADVRSKKYYVNGEVLRAGQFALVGPTTVLQALSQCGFAPFANTKKIRILRGSETLHFNYNEVIKGKHLEQNIEVKNGDYIIIP